MTKTFQAIHSVIGMILQLQKCIYQKIRQDDDKQNKINYASGSLSKSLIKMYDSSGYNWDNWEYRAAPE